MKVTLVHLDVLKTNTGPVIFSLVIFEDLLLVLRIGFFVVCLFVSNPYECFCANRPSLDVPKGRLPSAKPVSVQGPSEGKEVSGSEWDRPAGERTTQDRE